MAQLRSAAGLMRACWAGLVALALLARLAVPAGWMPVAGPDGVRLAICSGMASFGDGAMPGMAMPRMAMPQMATGPRHTPPADHGSPEPCDFAATALALTAPATLVLIAPAAMAHIAFTARPLAVTVGRGLAAPPPPATGPPLLG